MIALQRSAGNASTSALVRRAQEAPITLSLPGVVDHAAVSSWSLGPGGAPSTVNLIRPTDAESPRVMRAFSTGEPLGMATLVVSKLTPLGWVRQLTLTMDNCVVSSYALAEDSESIELTFTGMHFE